MYCRNSFTSCYFEMEHVFNVNSLVKSKTLHCGSMLDKIS